MPDCDVLIVGLGPVGQLLANLLGGYGRSVIAIDEAPGIHELPRAAVVDDEVLRIFQGAGLDEAVLREAQVQKRVTYVTEDGVGVDILRPESGPFDQPPLVSIHQPSMERTLVAGLDRFPGVELRWNSELESTDRAAGHVDAWIRPAGGGPLERIRSRWLVGCDGGRSAVRGRIGSSFGGSTFVQRWLVIDALVNEPIASAPHPHFAGHAEHPTVCLPMAPGRHRWEFMLQPGEAEEPFLVRERMEELMAPWLDGEEVEIERALIYTFHARMASVWRKGRMLLAGDAAHVMPPFVGQGFSSGARDAANLAWKLDAVLGGAPGTLLDTYEQERRPHTRQMQKLAAKWGGMLQTTNRKIAGVRDFLLPALEWAGIMGWTREHTKPIPAYPRGAFVSRPDRLAFRRGTGALFPQPVVRAGDEAVRLDDLIGDRWIVLAMDGQTASEAKVLGVDVLTSGEDFTDPEGAVGDWLERRSATWALLRPDRFVYSCGDRDDIAATRIALRRATGPGLRTTVRPEAVAA